MAAKLKASAGLMKYQYHRWRKEEMAAWRLSLKWRECGGVKMKKLSI